MKFGNFVLAGVLGAAGCVQLDNRDLTDLDGGTATGTTASGTSTTSGGHGGSPVTTGSTGNSGPSVTTGSSTTGAAGDLGSGGASAGGASGAAGGAAGGATGTTGGAAGASGGSAAGGSAGGSGAGGRGGGGTAGTTGGTGGTGGSADAGPAPPRCGDRHTDPNEECDDGNMTNGDGCDNCKFSCVTGDPVRNCVPANPCQTSSCVVATHICSPISTVGDNTSCGTGKYCKAGTCLQAVCGNGMTEPGETCDDGHQTSCGPCNASCTGPGTGSVCGDNLVCADTEACDDGDDIVCGTCNASCTGAGLTTNCCITANGNNRVVNGGFNSSDLSLWKPFDPDILLSYSTFDATGCGSSGSLLQTNAAPNGLNSGAYQCITVTVGATYNVGGRIRIPSGGARGQAFLNFVFTTMPNCFGNLIGDNLLSADYMNFDTWQYVHKENVVVPAGAVSMQVYASTVENLPDAKSFQSYYDMVYVTPVPGKF